MNSSSYKKVKIELLILVLKKPILRKNKTTYLLIKDYLIKFSHNKKIEDIAKLIERIFKRGKLMRKLNLLFMKELKRIKSHQDALNVGADFFKIIDMFWFKKKKELVFWEIIKYSVSLNS